MIYLLGEIWLWCLLSFLLGLLIGWWIWGGKTEVSGDLQAELDAANRRASEAADARARAEAALAQCRTDLDACNATLTAGAGAAAAAGLMAAAPVDSGPLPLFLDAPRGVPDDLRLIKGIGEKLNSLLTSIGIFHFRQIASWTAEDIDQVDAKLEVFKGRIVRDEWVAQAKLLAAGRADEFEAKYGKLGENN